MYVALRDILFDIICVVILSYFSLSELIVDGAITYLARVESMQCVAEGHECLEGEHLEDGLWGRQLKEQHQEHSVIGELPEFAGACLVIVDKNARNNAQHFVKEVHLRSRI